MNKKFSLLCIILSVSVVSPMRSSSSSYPYNITIVKAPDAWDFATGKGIIVAVIDSGLDLNNPDISSHVYTNQHEIPGDGIDNDHNGLIDDVHGWDFRNSDNNVDGADIYPHGTEMAGILVRNAPNVTILPIRFLDSTGSFSLVDTVTMLPDAINYAVSMNASVILMSFGHQNTFAQETIDSLQNAYDHNVTIVSSVGNAGQNAITYPAMYNTTIAVGSIDATKTLSSFSNYGTNMDFVAPGTGIETSDIGGSTVRIDGTSASAASVASLCALLYELNPSVSNPELYSILKNTAEDLYGTGKDISSGYGLVNFALAVRSVSDTSPPQLIINDISFTKATAYEGTMHLNFRIIEDTFIGGCTLHSRDASSANWTNESICSKTYLNSTNDILNISYDISTRYLVFTYYIEIVAIVQELSIGSASNPIYYPTGLTNQTSTAQTSPSQDTTNQTTSTTSGGLQTAQDQTGTWSTRPATSPFGLLGFVVALTILLLRRKLT